MPRQKGIARGRTAQCPACGSRVAPEFRFCGQCGASLPSNFAGPERSDQSNGDGAGGRGRGAPEKDDAERRQVTAMSCDIVSSTALSEHLDPEDLRDVILTYRHLCAGIIGHFGGHIARYVGDGLSVYFGYPRAHGDDAQRAVLAGLGITEQVHRRLRRGAGGEINVRIGIDTGTVVAGDIVGRTSGEALDIFGKPPSLAARLQELAEPNTVRIGKATYDLVKGAISCRPLGRHKIKGLSKPQEVFEPIAERNTWRGIEAPLPPSLPPLTGRDDELQLLLGRWNQVKERSGQLILLSGEAGIGKSRLLRALQAELGDDGHQELLCHCSPYTGNTALFPFINLFMRKLNFLPDDTSEQKLQKLEAAFRGFSMPLDEVVPLFASLLSLRPAGTYPCLSLSPQLRRRRTMKYLIDWILEQADTQPVFLCIDDLHWADASTIEFLGLLLDQIASARVLVLLAFRPQFRAPWSVRSNHSHIALGRLGAAQVRQMIGHLTPSKSLPEAVIRQVVTNTDGVPLFVEELTKTILDSGIVEGHEDRYLPTDSLQPFAIPTTLRDSLMARLDSMGAAKRVAQRAAVLGRSFTYELLRAISPLQEAELQKHLQRLVDGELLYQRGLPPDATYTFKHALIRDEAYRSLLKPKRQDRHRQIASVLVNQFADVAEAHPELLAHHCMEAGPDLAEQAIMQWRLAGSKAQQSSANKEAIGHLRKGLRLLDGLPPMADRDRLEVELLIPLGLALTAAEGYAAPDVEKTYDRARQLCQGLEDAPQLAPALRGLHGFHTVRGPLRTAREVATQLLDLAGGDNALRGDANRRLGWCLFCLGKLDESREHLLEAVGWYEQGEDRELGAEYGSDPGVLSLADSACLEWFVGNLDNSVERSEQSLKRAREMSHPLSQAYALGMAAMLHQLRGEARRAEKRARETVALAEENEFPYWRAIASIVLGWALVQQRQEKNGKARLQEGLADYLATGARLFKPYTLGLLANMRRTHKHAEEGLSYIDEALDTAESNDIHYFDAELYRIKGELLNAKGNDSATVRIPLERSIRVARDQAAKSLEMKAVTSLSRLLLRHGQEAEARRLVANVYSQFTQGLETQDLRKAASLLRKAS